MKNVLLIGLLIIAESTMAQKLIIENNVKFLALGDSYTIGESVPQSERWPVQLIQALRKKNVSCSDAKIIATTGWRTDQLRSAIESANLKSEYTLVSLLIGVNNQYQGRSAESYAPEFRELLEKAVALAGGVKSHVFVVSIPDYGYTPFGKANQPTITSAINAFNDVNKTIAQEIGVTYFNITDISRRGFDDPELVASDGLHPSGKMYTEWVELILKGIEIKPGSDEGEGDDDKVTGIKDERFGVQIYPNPFQSSLILENLLYLEQPVKFTLLDAEGAAAMKKEWMQVDTIEIDTTLLSPGFYMYQMETSSGDVLTGRLIKN